MPTATKTTTKKTATKPSAGHTLPAVPEAASKPASNDAIPMEELVEHIKHQAHLDRDFMGGGWDVIEDTWTDEMIAEAIQGAKTKLGAQSKMSKHVEPIRAAKRAAREQAKAEAEAAKTAEAEVEERSSE